MHKYFDCYLLSKWVFDDELVHGDDDEKKKLFGIEVKVEKKVRKMKQKQNKEVPLIVNSYKKGKMKNQMELIYRKRTKRGNFFERKSIEMVCGERKDDSFFCCCVYMCVFSPTIILLYV
jgi:hypothetical protein